MSKFRIHKNIERAKTLHSDYYTNDSIYHSSIEKIFSTSWQLIMHSSEIKHKAIPFNFMPDSISEPLILTKDNSIIKCISNVCTHRGHIVCNKNISRNTLTCRYHGRTFNLDGTLKVATGFDDVENFPTKEDNLKQISVKNWKDFIFVSLYNKLNINSILDDIETRLPSFPFNKISFSKSLSNTFNIDVHWALYCENYLEGFHVPFVHKGLSKEINNSTYETVLLKNGSVQFASTSSNNDKIYGYYYWIFPNIMLNFYKWGLSINIIEPINKNNTRIKFLSYPIRDFQGSLKEINNLLAIEFEDQSVVRSVQKGINSKIYKKGRYSALHEKGVHHFHQLLSKFI